MKPTAKFVLHGWVAFLFLVFITGCEEKDDPVVEADIVVSPENIGLNGTDTAFIYLSTKPEKHISWQATGIPDWLTVVPASGEIDGDIVEVKIISSVYGLEQGYHYDQLEFISDKAGKGVCGVELYLGANPVGLLTPTSLDFPVGIDSLTLTISNIGTGTLDWELSGDVNWISFEPSWGYLAGNQSGVVNVKVDRDNLAIGDHNAVIGLISNSSETVQNVSVTMAVPEMYTMTVKENWIYFGYFFEQKQVCLFNTGNMPFDWNLEFEAGYLMAGMTSGSLNAGDSALIMLTADRQDLTPGAHSTDLIFTNNKGFSVIAEAVVKKYLEEKWLLGSKIIDAEYDRVNDLIIAVTEYPYNLLKLDPVTQAQSSVPLNLIPVCVSVNPAGTHAAVGHDAKITYINLETMTVINVLNIPEIAGDIVIAPNSYAYVFPETGQWVKFLCVNLQTGVQDYSTGNYVNEGTRAKLHPSGNYIYGANNGLSPSDFEKYDIRNGVADYLYDSPYHGDYAFSGNIWIADDGNRLFARSRNVFIATENVATDMTYNGQLAGSNNVTTLDHSSAAGKIYAILYGGDIWDSYPSNEVRKYEATYLNYTGSVQLPGFLVPDGSGDGNYIESAGHFGFFNSNGSKFYVLVRAREGSGMLNDWAVVTVD